jgi:hypothetical protein
MADPGSFYALSYLQTRFGDEHDQRTTCWVNEIYKVFKNYVPINDVSVLDFGSGPVVQNSISIAGFASKIVFSRAAVQKWLDRDADAFDWSPHFDYIVKILEGKGEKEAREREEGMRQVATVAFCDAFSDTPMESGFEGPYDIILQCGCLEGACSDKESYDGCFKTLTSLLKPGGTMV